MKILSRISATILGVSFALGLVAPVTALAAGPLGVNLGAAGTFAILAKTGISTTGSTSVVGDIGVSPAAATYITGFALALPAASAFSTSAQVTGKVYAPGYADPTPANLTAAVLDMQNAYTDAAGRAPNVTELGAGNIGGLTLAPGVYKWGTGVTIPVDVTVSGGSNDVWIFEVAQDLKMSSAAKVVLSGGAQASNIFWVVAGQTTIGTGATFNGTILDQTSIVLNTGATLNGRALAQAAVTLDSNAVTIPSTTAPAPTPMQTPATTSVATLTATPAGGMTPPPAGATTYTQTSVVASPDPRVAALQTEIVGLSATLQTLQQAKMQGSSIRTLSLDLQQNSKNNDVGVLQQFLISQNKGAAAQALANAGATSYFGSMTRSALAEFQASVGITPALGNFGAITRAYIAAHY